jgi:signal transduction histidine kinase
VDGGTVGTTGQGDREPVPLPAWLRWLVPLWPVWAAAMVAALVGGLVWQHEALLVVCPAPEACGGFRVNASTAESLARHGIDLQLYAWLVAGAHLLFAALLFVLGYLSMRRSNRELLPVLMAWVFPALGSTFFVGEGVVSGVGWLGPVLFAAFVVNRVSFIPVLAIFPDGHFVPGWVRWIVLVAVPWELIVISTELAGGALPDALTLPSIAVTIATYGVLVGGQVYRYRRAPDPTARRQSQWVVAGFATMLVVALAFGATALLAPLDEGSLSWVLLEILASGAALIVLGAVFVSVIRFRLWGVEVVVQRILVWGTLTFGILCIYVMTVGASTGLLGFDDSSLPALVVAVAVAVGLQPARRRLQRFADRAMYGRRDEPVAITAGMAELFDDVSHPDQLLAALARLICRELKLPGASMLVELTDGTAVEGTHGVVADPGHVIPLIVGNDQVGSLTVAIRTGQRRLSAQDHDVLTLIAHQAAALAGMLRFAYERETMRQLVVSARDEERRRLRRDLHDGLGPTLASIVQRVDAAARNPTVAPEAVRLLDDATNGLRDALREMRRIIQALRPPQLDQHGLVGALRRSIDRHDSDPGLLVSFQAEEPLEPLGDGTELALFRIAEEAILNARRHANASRIELSLRCTDGQIELEVSDDGDGIAADCRPGVGISSMHERAAELGGGVEIHARGGRGTTVKARVPSGPRR